MTRRSKEERHRERWLVVLKKARSLNKEARAVIGYIVDRGLLEPDEAAILRHTARRDITTGVANDAFLWPTRYSVAIQVVLGVADSFVAWWLVGAPRHLVPAIVSALAAQLVAGVLGWMVIDAPPLWWRLGIRVPMPPRWVGDRLGVTLATAERLRVYQRLTYASAVSVPPIGIGIIMASGLRGTLAVALMAPLLTCALWLVTLTVVRACRNEQRWRFLAARDRALPLALSVALPLAWFLVRSDSTRATRHGAPLWLVAYFRSFTARNPQFLSEPQSLTGADHGRRRQREIVRTQSAFKALTEQYADRVERQVTPEQHREAVLEIRDHLRSALSGDLSFLDLSVAPPWWRRMLPRVGSAATLGVAAIALPYLPGVTASAGTLVGIQVGLAVAAVLTLVGAPAEVQKSVAEAVKSASAGTGK